MSSIGVKLEKSLAAQGNFIDRLGCNYNKTHAVSCSCCYSFTISGVGHQYNAIMLGLGANRCHFRCSLHQITELFDVQKRHNKSGIKDYWMVDHGSTSAEI